MMNSTLSKIIMFTAGAGIGSVITWRVMKTKYDQRIQEEIDSIYESFSRDLERQKDSADDEVESEDIPDEYYEKRYKDLVEESEYVTETDTDQNNEEKEDEEDMDRPYIIEPDEFGECDYETVSLTYYEGDGVLANDHDEVIEGDDIEEMVGSDFATHFGEYEEDSVFVRNDFFKIDYEILKDYRSFSEINN